MSETSTITLARVSLLDCLHPSVYEDGAGDADVPRCFRILLKLFTNHLEHPAEPQYASFSSISAAWQTNVLPCVYVLRLVEWMGCTPNAQGSRYVFMLTTTSTSDSSATSEGEAERLQRRVNELRCVMAAWGAPLAAVRASSSASTVAGESVEECSESLDGARQALVRLFAAVNGGGTALLCDDWTNSITRLLQLRLLMLISLTLWDSGAERVVTSGNWKERETWFLTTFPDSWLSQLLPPLGEKLSLLTAAPTRRTFLADHLEHSSIHWLLCHTSLRQLTAECTAAATTAAAMVEVARSHTASEGTSAAASTSLLAASRLPPTEASLPRPSSAAALADRFRKQARLEQHEAYLRSTGDAYRRLTQEERHRGESVVIDIAGLLEQLALVTETQGMVRADRQEAKRLLDEFKQDGDLVKLYALQDQYAEELEEAKRQYGKPLVFADYE